MKGLWIALVAVGGLALFGFLVVYEMHFQKVVGDMGEMQSSMSRLESNLGQSLGSLEDLSSLGGQLSSIRPELRKVNRQLTAVRGNTEAVQVLPALKRSLKPLIALGDQIAVLDRSIRVLPGVAKDIDELTAYIARLSTDMRNIRQVMKDVKRHVRNLDRKTGPPPP